MCAGMRDGNVDGSGFARPCLPLVAFVMAGTFRLDKWLWAARFYKTRSAAADAIDGGKVQVNGSRVKRGRPLQIGDRIRIRKVPYESIIEVVQLSEHRGSAMDAAGLYRETADSIAARKVLAEQHRVAAAISKPTKGRPTKRDRRRISRLKGTD